MSPAPAGYSIETITAPDDAELGVGGLAVRADGTLLASTRLGEIWAYDPGADEWSEVTDGLHTALGLWLDADSDDVFTAQMPALSRLVDDGDGTVDSFETLTDEWGFSGNYHEFAFGPVRDSAGNFYLTLNLSHGAGGSVKGSTMGHGAPWRGWAIQVTPDGEFVPYASGLRSPSGIGINGGDEVFYTDNQGDYVPACHLSLLQEGAFYGHPASLADHPEYEDEDLDSIPNSEYSAMRANHAVWIPYSEANAVAGLTFDEMGNFGPFEGQIFAGEQTQAKVMRFSLEQVNGVYQGAVFNFADGLQSGNVREAFTPDGQGLWLGQTARGWGSVGGAQYGVQRIDYDGETIPFEMKTVSVQDSGFEIEFTKPVDEVTAGDASNYDLSHWGYDNDEGYGSPRLDETSIASGDVTATVSDDGRTVTLDLPGLYLTPGDAAGMIGGTRVYELATSGIQSSNGEALEHPNAWYTLNTLPEGAITLSLDVGDAEPGTTMTTTGTLSNPSDAPLTDGELTLTGDSDTITVTPVSGTTFDTLASEADHTAEWDVSLSSEFTGGDLTLTVQATHDGNSVEQSTTAALVYNEPLSIPYGMDCGGSHTDETVTIDGLEFNPSPAESQSIEIGCSNRTLTEDEQWWPDQVQIDPNPSVYSADCAFNEIANTEHDALYQTEHWADGELTYAFTLENGTYDVTLHFSEVNAPASPQRVFDVSIQGDVVIEDLDPVAEAGVDTAIVYTFEDVEVTDGELTIEAASSQENPKFSGIEIRESL